MPIYEYECSQCGNVEEAVQKFSDAPLTTCKKCSGQLSKLISQSSFHLKGSGWYVTDYAAKNSGKEAAGMLRIMQLKTPAIHLPSPKKKRTRLQALTVKPPVRIKLRSAYLEALIFPTKSLWLRLTESVLTPIGGLFSFENTQHFGVFILKFTF